MLNKIKALPFLNILLALFSADLLFIVLHILHTIPSEVFPYLRDPVFALTRDLGLAESFGYVKEFWIVLIFFLLVIRFRKSAFLSWGILFIYLFFDDMFSIHEVFGAKLSTLFSEWPVIQNFENLRAADIGELVVTGLFGLFFLTIIAIAYFRAKPEVRVNFHVLFLFFGVLIFFGVGLDILDRFFNGRIVIEAFKLAEDGGETLAMSLICWYAYSLYENSIAAKTFSR